MASTTSLLILPNELFPFIFQYLSSIDLLKAFSDCKSRRLQALIQPFISRLDVSQESIEWIQIHLPELFIKYDFIALRLQMKDLIFISEHLLSTHIQSLEMIKWNFDFHIPDEVMSQLRRNLKKLLFAIPELDEDSELVNHLFQSDSQLEHLIINDCVLRFYDHEIGICTRLTHLSVELDGMRPVFILVKHLPSLQQLKVH